MFDKNTKDENWIKLIDFSYALKKDDISNDNWRKACQEDVDMLDKALQSFPLQSTKALVSESSKEFV